ncbi:MAG: hypothetical protein O7B99_06765 [Planctomycetota bacterium]|nr:hypothetical protein [Planctomycetota bacterium]
MKMISALLALQLMTSAQEGGQEPKPAEEPVGPPIVESPAPRSDWVRRDAVVAQVGDDVITESFIQNEIRNRKLRITTLQEMSDAFSQIVFLEIFSRLETQAGEDEEIYGEEQVDNYIENFLARRREQQGIVGYTDQILEEGLDPLYEKDRYRESLYRDLHRRAGLLGPRPTRDNYLRPGELHAIFRIRLPNLGEPDRVQLQILVISNAAVAGQNAPPAAARPLCEDLRKRLIAGDATFTELVEEFGVRRRESQGVTPLELASTLSPEERAFVDGAEIGAISEVLPVRPPGKTGNGAEPVAWEVIKLLVREEGAPPPDFTDRTIQTQLRQEVQDDREEKRLAESRFRAQRQAYVWLNPAYNRSDQEPPTAAAKQP